MQLFVLFSVLISLAAFFSYINVRLFKLPPGITLMLMGTLVSIAVIITGELSPAFTIYIKQQLSLINFSEFLLGILLSFLLFAGSLHVNYSSLRESAKSVISFATVGVLISTGLIATGIYYLLLLFNMQIPFIPCLLFGALISPTDPIAVLGILRKAHLPKKVEIKITGEALFNDGVGVVVFATILQIAQQGIENTGVASVLLLFAREAFGGIIAGWVIGYIGLKLMKSINHFQTEILITLAMVMGGYSLCLALHVSGPLAMVVAGLMTGNKEQEFILPDSTKNYLGIFWEVMDDVLNAILFMLIGLELVVISFQFRYFIVGLIAAIMLVFARYISLWIPAYIFRFKHTLEDDELKIMTWGGLRGGLSIALVLLLPNEPYKSVFVTITFIIVLFSILIQGLTIERLVKKLEN